MRKVLKSVAPMLVLFASSISNTNTLFAAPSLEPDSKAPYSILIDFDSGKTLYEKNADIAIPPSSMSKLMTVYYTFEKLKEGKYTLDTEFTVGPEAWKKAKEMNANSGSTMFLEQNEKVRLEDLIRGIIVNSGNDATIVIAENMSGSEDNFVIELNKLASRLGLKNTTLVNASGWYVPNHLMSVRDLSLLARRIIQDFPEYYHYFGQKEFLYKQDLTGNKDNRNKLLWIMPDSDGLKTGHTKQGGYALASSAKRGDRRLIAVVNGIKGNNASYARFSDSKALLEWGFREFSNLVYYKPNEKIIDVPVWFGKYDTVPSGTSEQIQITARRSETPNVEFRATYDSPIPAPVKAGEVIGTLSLYEDGTKVRDYELIALQDVRKISFIGRIFRNIQQIILYIVK